MHFHDDGVFRVEGVEFVESDNLGPFGEAGAIGFEFGLNGFVGSDRVFVGEIDEMQQDSGAFDVTQKIVTQSDAHVGAFNETGNVGKDRAVTGGFADDAKVGDEGGEGVVGDFGPCGGEGRDQGRFSGVGQADDAHFSEELEFEAEFALFAFFSRLRSFGGAVVVGEESGVSESAFAAFDDENGLIVVGEVADQVSGVCVEDFGAAGNQDNAIVAGWSGAVFDAAFCAVFAFDDALVAEVEEGLEVFVGFKNDVAAPSAVAAAGSACGHVFFTSEGYHPFSAVACDDLNFGLIDELHECGRGDLRSYIIGQRGIELVFEVAFQEKTMRRSFPLVSAVQLRMEVEIFQSLASVFILNLPGHCDV